MELFKSLFELGQELFLPMDQVMDLAEHILEWRKARLILPMTSRSVYAIAHDAPIEKYVVGRYP